MHPAGPSAYPGAGYPGARSQQKAAANLSLESE